MTVSLFIDIHPWQRSPVEVELGGRSEGKRCGWRIFEYDMEGKFDRLIVPKHHRFCVAERVSGTSSGYACVRASHGLYDLYPETMGMPTGRSQT
jgi:hypothetical protein